MSQASSPFHDHEAAPSPSTVGNTFMRQYYHFLAKEPQSLHRFYKAESRWCHGLGSRMEDPIAGQQAINDEILKRGYAGARVDLDIGSIDCQESLGGGVLVLVTGIMTLRGSPKPKPFVQTFFLAVQPKGYFVLNDCLRFLELTSGEENGKENKQLMENGQIMPTLSVEKKEEEIAGVVPPKKATNTSITTTKQVIKEKAPLSPLKATSTSFSSPVKQTTTTVTTEIEENPAEDIDKTPSPVVSPIKAQDSIPAVAEAPCVPSPSPADPVVSAPSGPEKPKTWAALFSVSKAATVTPSPAPSPAPVPAKVSGEVPTSDSPTSETSPKNKPGNGKDKGKEFKRLYSLFIRDLPPQTLENDLRELFKVYGSIAGVNVVPQRNFAFVDFYEQESMRAALAETKELKVQDKVLQVTERGDRKETQRSGFRGNDSRGRGRGFGPKSGRSDRKERNGEDTLFSSKGDRREGPRREKPGNRRGGKVDATSHNRAELAK